MTRKSDEANHSRMSPPHEIRDFPVTSGWNAFDVWWTRVRVRWVNPADDVTPPAQHAAYENPRVDRSSAS
ncbi:MAG: hypothetical protein WDO68_31080 [Gammaproteobacteria bacterium]